MSEIRGPGWWAQAPRRLPNDLEHDLAIHLDNPAWDYIKVLPNDDKFGALFGSSGVWSPLRWDDNYSVDHRSRVTSRWTWAIPAPGSIAFIIRHLDGRSVVELGAGNGYWAWLLRQSGIDVNAYDLNPLGTQDTWFNRQDPKTRSYQRKLNGADWPNSAEHYPITPGSHEALDLPKNHDRVLFLCWPDYDTTFAYDAVKTFRGDTVVYIGEGPGGCCGDSSFWSVMEGSEPYSYTDEPQVDGPAQEWEEVASQPMIQWAGLHDAISIYTRKEKS